MPNLPSTAISRLLGQLSGLEDPRQQAKVPYPLPEILLLGLAGSLAGADDVVEMVRWANLNADFLRRYYPYARGFPSHDTVGDVLNALNAQLFSELFIRWTNSLSAGAADLLNIDGKTSRRSGGHGQNPLHLVSAWANQQNLVLGIRHLISLPAGLTRMNFATFSFYTCLGAAVWSLVLVLMGYFIGGNEAVIKENLPYLTAAILLSVGAILGAYYWWQKR